MSTAERPSTADRTAAYAAWRSRLSQQVAETKVIDLSGEDGPIEPGEPAFDWSTDGLFEHSRRVAQDDAVS